MTQRKINFGAGPAALPLEALKLAQDEFLDLEGTGMSIVEHSHRDATFERINEEALSLVREVLNVPSSHEVLFMQGGARAQFALVPMNLMRSNDDSADYVVTGTWAKGAADEAKCFGKVHIAANTEESDKKFRRIPNTDELKWSAPRYRHITSNNTLFGTEWDQHPQKVFPFSEVPLVADMTSDLASRPIDISKFDLIYAGAQKNLGPTGVTVVIIKKSLIEEGRKDIPKIFQYRSFAESKSLFNTPVTFAVYLLRNTFRVWQERGLAAIETENRQKAKLLYETIDRFPEIYPATVERESRSIMNAVFGLPNEKLETAFIKGAADRGMVNIKGHRSVGGLRVSLYNAIRLRDVQMLTEYMIEFAADAGNPRPNVAT